MAPLSPTAVTPAVEKTRGCRGRRNEGTLLGGPLLSYRHPLFDSTKQLTGSHTKREIRSLLSPIRPGSLSASSTKSKRAPIVSCYKLCYVEETLRE